MKKPSTATENLPAVLHCDMCEMGEGMHTQWLSVEGFQVSVLCVRCSAKGILPVFDQAEYQHAMAALQAAGL